MKSLLKLFPCAFAALFSAEVFASSPEIPVPDGPVRAVPAGACKDGSCSFRPQADTDPVGPSPARDAMPQPVAPLEPEDGDVEIVNEIPPLNPEALGALEPRDAKFEPPDADVENRVPVQKARRPQPRRTAPPPAVVVPIPVPEPVPAPVPAPAPRNIGPAVVHVDASNYDAEIAGYRGPVLIDFAATWCGPCKLTAPIIDAWAEEFRGQVKVVKIDVDRARALALRHNVSGIPCLILINDGAETTRRVGEPPRDLLKRWMAGEK